MNSTIQLPTGPSAANDKKENLKLWLCELTHLTPQQVDRLIEQMEQQAQAQSA